MSSRLGVEYLEIEKKIKLTKNKQFWLVDGLQTNGKIESNSWIVRVVLGSEKG